jgi:hypothetical protein
VAFEKAAGNLLRKRLISPVRPFDLVPQQVVDAARRIYEAVMNKMAPGAAPSGAVRAEPLSLIVTSDSPAERTRGTNGGFRAPVGSQEHA